VAEAVRPRLFEPFAAGRPSGVGIGLAFSRTIARAHGGDLVLAEGESRTTFELELPMESR
jgi:signal transduction histidine kinase